MANRKDKFGKVLYPRESWNDNKKLYCYSYIDDMGVRRYKYAKTLSKLREKEQNLLKNKLDGLDIYVNGNADVNYVFDKYISTKRNLKSTTYSNYVYTYDHYVRDGFGRKKISAVNYSDIVIYYNSLLDDGLSISTVDNIHSVLHPTFKLAVLDRVITHNPTDNVLGEVKKNNNVEAGVRRALTLNQQRLFFKCLDEEQNRRWKPLFTVMFGTGCRIGELTGLRWCDIFFDDGYIDINHNLTYCKRRNSSNKCEYEISKPKTDAGIRQIPLLSEVREALLEEMDYQDSMNIHCTTEVGGMDGFIFCNRFGGLLNQGGVNKVIKRIVSDQNAREILEAKREKRNPVIIPMFSCHVARHTFCTRLCENETNIKAIQEIMGHKDIQTTMNIYAEVTEQKKKEIFKDLEKKGEIF